MLVFVWAAAGSAVWFIVLQKWVIGAFCPYCMTAHITGLLLATLVTWQSSKQFDDGSTGISKHSAPNSTMDEVIPVTVQDGSPTDSQRAISPLQGIGLALVGLTMTGILAVCQVVITPPLVYQGGETRDTQSAINAYGVPLIGSPDAQYVVTLLFDYTCPHCQQMHFMLNEIVRRYGGTLAFALSPTPLNRQCNPYVLQDVDEFKDACELAKISLAVWVADHALFPDFENWMFSFESGDRWRPRSLDDARAKAVELIGQEKYDDARMNPWIEQYLQTSVQIYGNTIQTGKSAIPKLVFGSRWVVPQPYDAEDLVPILRDSLGIPVDSFGP
jgi:protein-disulfide isomerase